MYRWSKSITFYRSIGWVVKYRCYKIGAGEIDRLDPSIIHDKFLAFLVWDAAEQKWEVQIGHGADSQCFTTDQGTYRKPPRELVELLVAARGS
jgi:hypothetical protein